MKTLKQILHHKELVVEAFQLYGRTLVEEACRLYQPESPAFYRAQLKVGLGEVDATKLHGHLAQRVATHDGDKLSIVRTIEQGDVSTTSMKRLCYLYALHDLNHDHHAACWARNIQTFQVGSFLEHLLDHVALQLDQGEAPFDLQWLRTQQAFYGKRVHTEEGDYNDLEAVFNMNNQNIRFAVSSAAKMYKRWVDYFTACLNDINKRG